METQTLSRYCVYTIRHTDDLEAIGEGGSGSFEENRKWVEGSRLFHEARRRGEKMPIVFAPAERAGGLTHYAILEDVEVDASDPDAPVTEYRFSGLASIEGEPAKSTLLKKSNREPLSDDFIRPYALCYTPDFVEKAWQRSSVSTADVEVL